MNHILPRRKPGPPGKVALREALVAEHRRTGASPHSLARKYGVSSGTAWKWVYGKPSRPRRGPDPRYPHPLPDALWQRLEPLLRPKGKGAPARYAKRSIVEAIFLVLREGRFWEDLPPGYPPGRAVGEHYRDWVRRGVWAEVERLLNDPRDDPLSGRALPVHHADDPLRDG
ncbi:transposase [Meiothermus sp.]|uniref:transposase n=1 Tax=Meiothermus sp. TaxID=1955249 RepID=UPI0026349E32|nr:transposase [Meiothermus sp.]